MWAVIPAGDARKYGGMVAKKNRHTLPLFSKSMRLFCMGGEAHIFLQKMFSETLATLKGVCYNDTKTKYPPKRGNLEEETPRPGRRPLWKVDRLIASDNHHNG